MTYATNVPDFRVVVDGTDLSDRLRPRLISLRLSEKRGGDADQLEIALDDANGRLDLPRQGATIELALGWSAGSDVVVGLIDKGRFTVDSVTHAGPPDQITVQAHAADFTGAARTTRDQSWHDTTLGAIVEEVAGRCALKPRCAPALAAKPIASLSQSRESDLAFVRRLGRDHDATATFKVGALIFAPAGSPVTAGGAAIPALTIARGDGDRHSFFIDKAEEDGAVEAQWHDRRAAKRETVTVGEGEGPTRRLSRTYGSEAAARDAATAERSRNARAPKKLSLGLALGRLEIYPDRPVSVSGFKPAIDALSWIVADVTHELGDRGFTTAVNLEITG